MSRPLTVAAAVLSATVLSACGTGLQAQTYKEIGRQDSARTDLDHLSIRNLYVEGPADDNLLATGKQAVLTGSFVNTGTTDDSLTTLSTDVAGSVALMMDDKSATAIDVPAGGSAGSWTAVLDGLTKDLHAGEYVSVTLTFAHAGRTTLKVPVRAGDNGLKARKPAQDPYSEG